MDIVAILNSELRDRSIELIHSTADTRTYVMRNTAGREIDRIEVVQVNE
jgi:hypothetical protein